MSQGIDPLVSAHIATAKSIVAADWIPHYLYHHSDISNVVQILESGELLSRKSAIDTSSLVVDSASVEVLDKTPKWVESCVRLYFRPRTPPLFHIEGIRSASHSKTAYDARCPVPIYLLFRAETLLSMTDMRFSDGNLSRSDTTNTYNDLQDLSKLDIEKIYNDSGSPSDGDRQEITRCKCAEVVIPNKLKLGSNLSHVCCRSEAEKETLLNSLTNSTRKQYSQVVRVVPSCFFRRWSYVESVNLLGREILFTINQENLLDKCTFDYELVSSAETRKITLDKPMNKIQLKPHSGTYTITLNIDNMLAYKGVYDPIMTI